MLDLASNAAAWGSTRTRHFRPPPQWEAMRQAEAIEARGGRRILHLDRGDFAGPDFGPAPEIVEAASRALADGEVRYRPGPGLGGLREALAEHIARRGRPTHPEEVVVTMGAKHALTMALLTLLDDGDEVVFPDPGYPPDAFWVEFAGARTVHLPFTAGTFQVDLDVLETILDRGPRLLILNSPQRPNGRILENLPTVARMCRDRGVLVLSDEIFAGLMHAPHIHSSITAEEGMAERSVLVDTFSKAHVMTGFRVGFCVAPKPLAQLLDVFLQNSVTNVPVFVQRAAQAALAADPSHMERVRSVLRERRDRLVDALDALPGLTCDCPEGAFYAFPSIAGLGLDAADFARRLLLEEGVSVVPGTAFGGMGAGHVRMTYAVEADVLEESILRIERFVQRLVDAARSTRAAASEAEIDATDGN